MMIFAGFRFFPRFTMCLVALLMGHALEPTSVAGYDVPTPPAAPSQPRAFADYHGDRLAWNWRDNSSDEDGFKLWADQGTGAPQTLKTTTAAGVTSWTQTGLTPNTPYTFQVSAVRGGTESARSDALTTWTQIEIVRKLAASNIGADYATVTPVSTLSNLTTGLSGFIVEDPEPLGGSWSSGWRQDTSGVSFTGLTPNACHNFFARSRNAAGVETPTMTILQVYTLPLPPTMGHCLKCDQTTGTALTQGTAITFSNQFGFGLSSPHGNPWTVSDFRYVWDTSPTHTFTGTESLWSAGTLSKTPAVAGAYYIHLQARNNMRAVQPVTLDYGPFLINPSAAVLQTLTIASTHGIPAPAIGDWTVNAGTQVTASAPATAPDPSGTTRWVCTGWTASGAAPASGTGNSVTFNLTQPTAITWHWKAQYQLSVSVTPATAGVVISGDASSPAAGWYDVGAQVEVRAVANAGFCFAGWGGDLNGSNTTTMLQLDHPGAITAQFRVPNALRRWVIYQ